MTFFTTAPSAKVVAAYGKAEGIPVPNDPAAKPQSTGQYLFRESKDRDAIILCVACDGKVVAHTLRLGKDGVLELNGNLLVRAIGSIHPIFPILSIPLTIVPVIGQAVGDSDERDVVKELDEIPTFLASHTLAMSFGAELKNGVEVAVESTVIPVVTADTELDDHGNFWYVHF